MTGRRACLVVLAFLICQLTPGQARADQVVLANGDRISGVITTMTEGKLTIETKYSDPITIETSSISTLSTEGELEVHLRGGEIKSGKLAPSGPGSVLLLPHADTAGVRIAWRDISSINPPERNWSANLTLGANVQSGNTARGSGSVEGEARWRGDSNRIGFRFLFNYAEEEGNLTARNTYAGLNHDHFFNGSLYSHLGLELLSDEFRDLTLRTVVGPAVGYQLWKERTRSLGVELGVSYFREDHRDDNDTSWATARAAAALSWQVLAGVTLTNRLVMYPGLQKLGEYQLRNEASVTSSLQTGWAIKLSNIIEFDSTPPSDVQNTDLFWTLGLQRSF